MLYWDLFVLDFCQLNSILQFILRQEKRTILILKTKTIKTIFWSLSSNSWPNLIFCLFQGPSITWRQFICRLLGLQSDSVFYDNLLEMVTDRVGGGAKRSNAIVQVNNQFSLPRVGLEVKAVFLQTEMNFGSLRLFFKHHSQTLWKTLICMCDVIPQTGECT